MPISIPTKASATRLDEPTSTAATSRAGSYTYVGEGDKELKSFSVDHDKQFRIPFIKRAMAAARRNAHALLQPLESAGIHEDQQRHAARWETEDRSSRSRGPTTT